MIHACSGTLRSESFTLSRTIGPQINTVLAAGSIPKRKGTIEAFTRLLLNRPFIATWALLKFFSFLHHSLQKCNGIKYYQRFNGSSGCGSLYDSVNRYIWRKAIQKDCCNRCRDHSHPHRLFIHITPMITQNTSTNFKMSIYYT